ncbi:hypothetical protein ABEW05_008581 [Botrytis cinerea]
MSATEANPVTDPETQSIMEDLIAKMGADESFTEYANDQHTQLQMYIEQCRAHLNILAEDRQLYRQMYLEKHRAHLAQERVERWWEKFIGIVTIAVQFPFSISLPDDERLLIAQNIYLPLLYTARRYFTFVEISSSHSLGKYGTDCLKRNIGGDEVNSF